MKVHREQFLAAAMMLSAAAPLGGCRAKSDQAAPESINAEGAQAIGQNAPNAPTGAAALNGAAPTRVTTQNSPLGMKGVAINPTRVGMAAPAGEAGLVAPVGEAGVVAPTREAFGVAPTREAGVGVVAPTREALVVPRATVTTPTPTKVPPPPAGRPQLSTPKKS